MRMINKVLTLFFVVLVSACWRTNSTGDDSLRLSAVTFDEHTVPVVVLGGGIAGLTSAVYLSQAGITCVVIEGPKPGGSLSQSHSVRNWPGVINAPGKEIVDDLRKQVTTASVAVTQEQVVSVDFKQWPRVIEVQDLQDPSVKKTIRALSVIIAMGTEPNMLGIPGESGPEGYWGKGVGNCAVCEGSLYKDKIVAIIGGGDAAVIEAEYLADIAKKVYVLIRKDVFKAKDTVAKDALVARSNVEVLYNTEIGSIGGDKEHITHVVIHNNKTNEQKELPLDGLFLAIGSHPNTAVLKQVELDKSGFVVLKNGQETSAKGIYAAGDIAVSQQEIGQAVIASSDGCKAALQAIKFLKEIGFSKSKYAQVGESKTVIKEREKIQEKAPVAEHRVAEIFSKSDFETMVLQAKIPVVIDIFSTLCIPCQKMAPIVDRLAQLFEKDVAFVKLNIANKSFNVARSIASMGGHQISTVPTFVFVSNGKEVGRIQGEQDLDSFKQKIKNIFNVN
jgi:thioredoxin reductase (NADPH)